MAYNNISKKLEEIEFNKIKEMCEKVGLDNLKKGNTSGHLMAFVGCVEADSAEDKLRQIEKHEQDKNRLNEIIRQKKVSLKNQSSILRIK